MPDASEVMEMLLKTQKGENEEMQDDDPQVGARAFYAGWVVFC